MFTLKQQYISKTPESRLYQVDCPVIGLTGGIATGKSTVSKILEDKGLAVICADKLVKEVYQSQKTIDHLKSHYPSVLKAKEIDFSKLRELFFGDKKIQEDVEKLIYSQMPETFLKKYNSFKDPQILIYDVPLLFEKGLDKLVDVTVTVYCPVEVQLERLIIRDGISEELARNIISKQMPIDEKAKKSDIIIDNSQKQPNLVHFLNCFL